MCGCKHHYLKSAPCTCACDIHRHARRVARKVDAEDKDNLYVEDVTEAADDDTSAPANVTEPSVGNSDDATEPEDKADLYVEPEPLKAGDWIQVWARVDDNEDVDVAVESGHTRLRLFMADDWFHAGVRNDAIVRPDAGQVPPWVKPARCTSLWEAGGRYARCDLNDGHKGDPHGTQAEGWMWTTADEAGRITEGGAS